MKANNCIVGPDWAPEATLVRRTSVQLDNADAKIRQDGKSFLRNFFESISSLGESLEEESEETLAQQKAHDAAFSKEVRQHFMQSEARRICVDHESFVDFKRKVLDSKLKSHTATLTPEAYMQHLAANHVEHEDSDHQDKMPDSP